MTDHKKPGVVFWATVVVCLLVAYPLSLFPIAWLENRGMIPEQESIIGGILWMYCAPARWLIQLRDGPAWIQGCLNWAFGS